VSVQSVIQKHFETPSRFDGLESSGVGAGPALASAGPNARPRRGAPLSSDFMTSSCSVNRVTIVVERRYTVKH